MARVNVLFKNPASASSVERPRKFKDPSPRMLFQDALRTIASVPEERGEASIANAFVPSMICVTSYFQNYDCRMTLTGVCPVNL